MTTDDQARRGRRGDPAGEDSAHGDRASRAPVTDSAPDSLPERRTLRGRLGSPVTPSQDKGNPLVETTMTSVSGLDMLSTAFRVREDGGVAPDQSAAPIAAPLTRIDQEGTVSLEEAQAHHLFLLPDEVSSDELEALAVSVWDDAGWAGPGMLRLGGGAHLRGPWAVDTQTRRALGTPSALTRAWLVICPPMRGAVPTPELMEHDPWAHAFPQGMPVGIELKILLTLRRMARRLCGALRIQGSGDLLAPDPDSAVNLTVYSRRWVAPETLLAALRANFPTIIDSRDLPHLPRPRLTAREVERIQTIAQSIPALPPEVSRTLEEARRRAFSEPQTVTGYALIAPAGNRSELMVEVNAAPRPPQVLRWETWTNGAIIEYLVRWIPGPGIEILPGRLSRTARLERMRAAQDVERAAVTVIETVGGSVIDEDGFLVALDVDASPGM